MPLHDEMMIFLFSPCWFDYHDDGLMMPLPVAIVKIKVVLNIA